MFGLFPLGVKVSLDRPVIVFCPRNNWKAAGTSHSVRRVRKAGTNRLAIDAAKISYRCLTATGNQAGVPEGGGREKLSEVSSQKGNRSELLPGSIVRRRLLLPNLPTI